MTRKPNSLPGVASRISFFDSQDKAVADLKALGLDIDYRTDHGRHEWYYWEKQLEAYLEWLPIDYVKEERLS